MTTRYLVASYLCLATAVLMFAFFGVMLDGVVAQWTPAVQRWAVVGTHIAPALLGAVCGILSLMRERRRALAGISIVANTLFAAFFIVVLVLAG